MTEVERLQREIEIRDKMLLAFYTQVRGALEEFHSSVNHWNKEMRYLPTFEVFQVNLRSKVEKESPATEEDLFS